VNCAVAGGIMNKRVLLIEDEPHIIEAITFLLERDGWRVTAHSNGADAVRKVAQTEPDLIILDVMLPNRSGFDVLREIRRTASMAALPVLMLTAKGQVKDREAAIEAGASLFMTKPFSNQEILENVQKLVR
jgi:two-component system, OmpR family, response regulator